MLDRKPFLSNSRHPDEQFVYNMAVGLFSIFITFWGLCNERFGFQEKFDVSENCVPLNIGQIVYNIKNKKEINQLKKVEIKKQQ